MKAFAFIFTAAALFGAGPASAVTLAFTITGLASGTPSPLWSGVGSGTPGVLTFDLPSTDGGGASVFPLSVVVSGFPATGAGFSFGPPAAEMTPVTLSGSVGVVGDPTAVQLHSVTLTGPVSVNLNNYTVFVPGEGLVPMVLGDAVEAAAVASDLTQGTLTLIDQVVSPLPGSGNRWTYSFTVVPEPSVTGLGLAFLLGSMGARRRSRA